jgi:hypothetical protein
MLLEPDNGRPGDVITVTGRYFPAGEPLVLQLQVDGNPIYQSHLGEAMTDGEGRFRIPLALPQTWRDRDEPLRQSELLVEAVGKDTSLASAAFFNLAGAPAWTSYRPLDETSCSALQDSLAARLEQPVQRSAGPLLFAETTEVRGQSCQLFLVVSVDEVESTSQIAADLLQSRGWEALTPTRLQQGSRVAALHRSRPAGDMLMFTVELAEPDSPTPVP